MRSGMLLAYQSDLQYIKGRLALHRQLKDGKHIEAAGQVMSDLLEHIDHNIVGLIRLIGGDEA